MKSINTEMSDVIKRVSNVLNMFINGNYTQEESKIIIREVEEILNHKLEVFENPVSDITYEEIQKIFSSINEKSENRKSKGVYYTPIDLVKFITINSVKLWFEILKPNNLHVLDLNGVPYNKFCYTTTMFDPTCGVGEFLLNSLDLKLDLLELHHENVTKGKIKKVITTLYGNDINDESILITKIRLFLTVLHRFGVKKIIGISSMLNNNFTTIDYIENPQMITNKFDIIIGNPPYVEDTKSESTPIINYGNVYANVLDNSVNHINENGVLGYVIPLSYVSTPRMKKIRDAINIKLKEQYILSYSDRPDCLFTSVHQKLNIFFAKKIDKEICYTSNYQYWYKEEREKLFEETTAIENSYFSGNFIPKLGNSKDKKIFEKVYSTDNSIVDNYTLDGRALHLNMRATFWIKAFIGEHTGSEYKQLIFDEDVCYLMMCIFNSSLFWWYWICVSDCWHITNKELTNFRIPKRFNREKAKELAKKLERHLEETKVFVGTKQTEYEYKHKDCIEVIHEIDDYIAKIYGLSQKENLYIKNYNLRYRIGGGALK